MLFFFFQAEDGIRDSSVTGVQTCALPISELLAILQKTVRESPEFNQGISKEELTLLPTGDGMALVFFRRDPVSPVKCALEIAASLKDHPEIKLRMGIHHGPARPQLDIKDELYVVGGGITKAHRVMDFGDTR